MFALFLSMEELSEPKTPMVSSNNTEKQAWCQSWDGHKQSLKHPFVSTWKSPNFATRLELVYALLDDRTYVWGPIFFLNSNV